MTHLLQPPEPIAVEPDARGEPQRFHWQSSHYRVVEICNHWRVATEWWREEHQYDTYKVVTDTGLLCLIVHDQLSSMWLLERIFE